jgi:transcriptional regulator with XRE-family HTH domain
LISEQIKMARAALGWSIEQLADRTEVSSRTIKRIEAQSGSPAATAANLRLIRTTLEDAGIEFIGDATEGPGVRLWKKPHT